MKMNVEMKAKMDEMVRKMHYMVEQWKKLDDLFSAASGDDDNNESEDEGDNTSDYELEEDE